MQIPTQSSLRSNQGCVRFQLLNNLTAILGLSKTFRPKSKQMFEGFYNFLKFLFTMRIPSTHVFVGYVKALVSYYMIFCFFLCCVYSHPHHVPVVSLKEAQKR